MVEVGDEVELAPAKVGQRPRRGVVRAVRGRMITVLWESGEESTVVPASGTLSVLGHKAKRAGQTAKKVTKTTGRAREAAAKKSRKR